MSKYKTARTNIISQSGGSVRVTIDSDSVGQGNGGTALSCKGCWVSPASANSGITKMNISAAAESDVGIELSDSDTGGGPLFVPIDDVDKLYFYGTAGDYIDITYLKG